MPKVFLTPFLIAGLLLLPSCSSAEKKLCNKAEIARQDYYDEAASFQSRAKAFPEGSVTWDYERKAFEAYKNSLQVILNNPKCFTPQQVVEAQDYLAANK